MNGRKNKVSNNVGSCSSVVMICVGLQDQRWTNTTRTTSKTKQTTIGIHDVPDVEGMRPRDRGTRVSGWSAGCARLRSRLVTACWRRREDAGGRSERGETVSCVGVCRSSVVFGTVSASGLTSSSDSAGVSFGVPTSPMPVKKGWIWFKWPPKFQQISHAEIIWPKTGNGIWGLAEWWASAARDMLTHLPLDKMAAVSQTIFSDAFSWMKIFVFGLKFHWNLFLRV